MKITIIVCLDVIDVNQTTVTQKAFMSLDIGKKKILLRINKVTNQVTTIAAYTAIKVVIRDYSF